MRAAHLLRRPVGLAGLGLLVVVLSVALLGPILWGERATVVDTGNLLAARRPSTGSAPTTSAGTCSTGCS
ncbi:hypothetical protein ACFQ0B_47150 [Nonomuraea thailandensis]